MTDLAVLRRVREALQQGATGFAIDVLLNEPDGEYWRWLLQRGEWSVEVVPNGAVANACRGWRGVHSDLDPPRGVYALAACSVGDGLHAGAVHRVELEPGWAESAFARGAAPGISQASLWLVGREGLVDLPTARSVRAYLLTGGAAPDGPGDSAALAAALIFVRLAGGEAAARFDWLAATGRVAPDGRVLPVEHLACKFAALLADAPFVQRVYVPMAQMGALPVELQARALGVETVEQALLDAFRIEDLRPLPRQRPLDAVRQADDLEARNEHAVAERLAEEVLAEVARARPGLGPGEEVDRTLAEVTARRLVAAQARHRGSSRRAWAELGRARELVDRGAPVDGPELASLHAALAMTAMDLLRPDEAVVHALALPDHVMPLLPHESQVRMWGTRAKALAFAGRLDEAEAAARAQLAVPLGTRGIHHRARNLCNLIAVLLRRVAAGQVERLPEVDAALAEAYASLDSNPHATSRRVSKTYVDLLQLRRWALEPGHGARARDLVGGDAGHDGGRFPYLYRHRFAAEAQARDGQVEEALHRLGDLVARIDGACGPFERLSLETARASAAVLRIEAGMGGWEEEARRFLVAVQDWSPMFVSLPRQEPSTDTAAVWHGELLRVLAAWTD